MNAILFRNVSRSFDGSLAVDDLTLEVPSGQIFGFLGGNGAGKTTSIRMMMGLLSPDEGSIELMGRPPGRGQAALVGFLPEERGLYRSMTAIESVAYFGRLKGMRSDHADRRAREILTRFGLGDRLKANVIDLSKGNAQKVQLAAAIVNEPRLVVLDEPFSGLDPVNQDLLEREIIELRDGGATVLLSTHIMQHAERLCDRLSLMVRGRKVFEGTLNDALGTMPSHLTITSRLEPSGIPMVFAYERAGQISDWTRWSIQLINGATADDFLEFTTSNAFVIREMRGGRTTLHDAFMGMVRSHGADNA